MFEHIFGDFVFFDASAPPRNAPRKSGTTKKLHISQPSFSQKNICILFFFNCKSCNLIKWSPTNRSPRKHSLYFEEIIIIIIKKNYSFSLGKLLDFLERITIFDFLKRKSSDCHTKMMGRNLLIKWKRGQRERGGPRTIYTWVRHISSVFHTSSFCSRV